MGFYDKETFGPHSPPPTEWRRGDGMWLGGDPEIAPLCLGQSIESDHGQTAIAMDGKASLEKWGRKGKELGRWEEPSNYT